MPSTTNFSWTTPADTDYVKDGASAIRTLANGIDTSMAQLKGGTTGQILSKTNGTDMAFTWINNDQGDLTAITAGTGISVTSGTGPIPTIAIDTATTVDKTTAQTLTNKTLTAPVISTISNTGTLTLPTSTGTLALTSGVINNTLTTTTGDLIYASSANTPARLGIGSSNQVLTVSGGVPVWATPAGGGKCLQVVSTTKTDTFTTTSSTYTDVTGYSVTITPSATTSKILVIYDISITSDPSTHCARAQLMRGTTALKIGDAASNRTRVTGQMDSANYYNDLPVLSGSYFDSPATTSATTYKIQVARVGGTASDIVGVNRGELDDDTSARPRGACTITVMEIGA